MIYVLILDSQFSEINQSFVFIEVWCRRECITFIVLNLSSYSGVLALPYFKWFHDMIWSPLEFSFYNEINVLYSISFSTSHNCCKLRNTLLWFASSDSSYGSVCSLSYNSYFSSEDIYAGCWLLTAENDVFQPPIINFFVFVWNRWCFECIEDQFGWP